MIQRQRSEAGDSGLPMWLNVTVVLTLLGLLAWNVVVNKEEGVPTSYVLGGLLGAYAGVERLIRRPGGGPSRNEEPSA